MPKLIGGPNLTEVIFVRVSKNAYEYAWGYGKKKYRSVSRYINHLICVDKAVERRRERHDKNNRAYRERLRVKKALTSKESN